MCKHFLLYRPNSWRKHRWNQFSRLFHSQKSQAWSLYNKTRITVNTSKFIAYSFEKTHTKHRIMENAVIPKQNIKYRVRAFTSSHATVGGVLSKAKPMQIYILISESKSHPRRHLHSIRHDQMAAAGHRQQLWQRFVATSLVVLIRGQMRQPLHRLARSYLHYAS